MSMYKKQTLYQQEGKRLVSVYPADLPELGILLPTKLRLFGYAVGMDERIDVSKNTNLAVGQGGILVTAWARRRSSFP